VRALSTGRMRPTAAIAALRHEREPEQEARGARGEGAEQGMQEVDCAQIDGKPRHVEQRGRCGA
jgi:hypothetical protein